MPILEDLYVELKIQPEPEAQRIATALEIYVHGSLNLFNHRTNVNLKNRLVCYDIKGLGKQLKKLGDAYRAGSGLEQGDDQPCAEEIDPVLHG